MVILMKLMEQSVLYPKDPANRVK